MEEFEAMPNLSGLARFSSTSPNVLTLVLNNNAISTLAEPNTSHYAIPNIETTHYQKGRLRINFFLKLKPKLRESPLPSTKLVRHT